MNYICIQHVKFRKTKLNTHTTTAGGKLYKNGYYVHKQNELYRDWWVTSFQLSILSFNSIDHSHKVYIPANKVKTLKSASFSKDASCYTIFNYLLQLYCITTCYLTFKTMLLLDQGKHKLIWFIYKTINIYNEKNK